MKAKGLFRFTFFSFKNILKTFRKSIQTCLSNDSDVFMDLVLKDLSMCACAQPSNF